MVVTTKNGLKLDISPADWRNPKDWIAFFMAIYFAKTHNIYMRMEDWKFYKGGSYEE